MLTAIYFYAVAALILIFALMVITCRNPVHAVLSLIMVFINASVLFLMAHAEFLAMSLVIVYVGAVAVLFLFVVMMLDIKIEEIRGKFASYAPLGIIVSVTFLLQLLFAVSYSSSTGNYGDTPSQALYPISQDMTNTHQLGSVLYTDYFLAFQLSGLILLLAMVGAIVLTHRARSGVKRQNISQQLACDPNQSIKLIKPEVGKGVKDVYFN